MKFLQIILIFAVCITLSACGGDAKEKTMAKPDNTAQSNQAKTIKKPVAKANNSAFQKLTKIKPSTRYAVGSVNKQKPNNGSAPIVVKGPRFTMTGWAIDSKTNQPAGDVYVIIAGKPYLAKYGSSRPDVAKVMNNPNLTNTGFALNIPSGAIPKGQHEVKVRVVSTDKKRVYSNNDKVKILIDVK